MTGLSDVANDERTARMVLSMLVEPNDPVTGRLSARVGALEVLRLAERNGEVSGLDSVDTQVWRDHFNTSEVRSITERLSQIQQSTRLGDLPETAAVGQAPPPATSRSPLLHCEPPHPDQLPRKARHVDVAGSRSARPGARHRRRARRRASGSSGRAAQRGAARPAPRTPADHRRGPAAPVRLVHHRAMVPLG